MSSFSSEMKAAWNSRARKDAYYYVETKFWNHDRKTFFVLGEERAALLIDPVLNGFRIDCDTAIDLGCGVGRFTQALGRRFRKAVGIDVSEGMVTQAREDARGLPNLEFIASDGIFLPQPEQSADFVWSYEVFQHMPSHDVIQSNLHEVARVLRPNGHGLIHFRSAHDRPIVLWHAARLVPTFPLRIAKRVLGKDPLTVDKSWHGAEPLNQAAIQDMCEVANLEIVAFRDDPTHEPGTRIFAVVRRQRL